MMRSQSVVCMPDFVSVTIIGMSFGIFVRFINVSLLCSLGRLCVFTAFVWILWIWRSCLILTVALNWVDLIFRMLDVSEHSWGIVMARAKFSSWFRVWEPFGQIMDVGPRVTLEISMTSWISFVWRAKPMSMGQLSYCLIWRMGLFVSVIVFPLMRSTLSILTIVKSSLSACVWSISCSPWKNFMW